MVKDYPSAPGFNYPSPEYPADVPPLDFVARLARLGLRLRDDGLLLVVVGPDAVAAEPWWPSLDRRLAHWAPWLADSAAVVEDVRESGTPAEIREFLRSLAEPLAGLAREAAGGRQAFAELLAGDLESADLTVACAAAGVVKVLLDAIAEEVEAAELEEALLLGAWTAWPGLAAGGTLE
jgi:hypothetical protein